MIARPLCMTLQPRSNLFYQPLIFARLRLAALPKINLFFFLRLDRVNEGTYSYENFLHYALNAVPLAGSYRTMCLISTFG